MLYNTITKDDMLNGEGLRVVLWVAGCEHHCPGCHNPQTWSPERGEPFTEWEYGDLMEKVNKPYISGITFSGGDPLHPVWRNAIGRIAKAVKSIEGKDIWLYTGYSLSFEDGKPVLADEVIGKRLTLDDVPWLGEVDILVDGRFEEETRKSDLMASNDPYWRGSSNQKVIDVKTSLERGEVVKYID